MKNLKKIISVTAAAAMVMSTVAPVSVFADDATFKIGGIGPVTGAAAIYGQAVKNATELAINEVNEDGGINGYQVEFKFEDDENDAEKTLNAYNALKDVVATPPLVGSRKTLTLSLTDKISLISLFKRQQSLFIFTSNPKSSR